MALYVYNKSGSPVTLTGTTVVVPASAAPPAKSVPVNVTSELAGKSGGFYTALETQRGAIPLEYMWTSGVAEFSVGTLTVDAGPAPGAHESTHATGGTDALTVVSLVANYGESFPALLTAGTAIHAQANGGAPLNLTSGFTIPYPRRTVEIVVGVGGANPTVYTVTGTASDGSPLTDVITATGAGTYQGVKAFETITSVTSDVDPVGTTDVKTGTGFAVARPFTGTPVLGVDGAVGTISSSDAASGTIVPSTAPNGTHNYSVRYSATHTHNLT